jgi:pimeloyl-ACP methyl ester carboxylesterase
MDLLAGLAAFAPLLLGQTEAPQPDMPTPRDLWDRVAFPPLEYRVEQDQVIQSYTDPTQDLRRIDVTFTSQIHHGVRMDHTATIFMPADPSANEAPERKGKVVVVGQRRGDEPVLWNYGEPIAARMRYPTMVIDVPGAFDGEDGEGRWIHHTSDVGRATQDATDHNYFRLAVCYLKALDLLEDVLGLESVRAVIGGHSKRATSAFTAAAIDPERIAGVVYMGNESTFERMDADYRRPFSPNRTTKWVTCPVVYLGATNEDGYEMFAINRIQAAMARPWTIEYIPNYRHASNSEKQFMDWQMWVSHVFDGRPITRIGEPSQQATARGLSMRARVESPNHIIQVKFWTVYCDDVPYWRDLVWYPVYNVRRHGEVYEGFADGKLPDAWLVEVKDTAMGFPGYVSSLPQKVSDKPTAVRESRGSRSRHWEPAE